jgi:hypothetical protein
MKKRSLLLLFVLLGTTLFAKNHKNKAYIDLYGGYGSKGIYGTEFDESKSRPGFYGSARIGYKFFQKIQLETGYSSGRYGCKELFDIDGERYYGGTYISKYRQIPMLIRFKAYKGLWFGAGAQYDILDNSKFYPAQEESSNDFTSITSSLKPKVWNTYFDVKLVYEDVALGANYTRSLTPVGTRPEEWRNATFNLYISIELNTLLRPFIYKYFGISY